MTIERQYSLPNCKLILQGLPQGSDGKSDGRASLNRLMNAECHFVGYPQPITGGREFFESLVRQVSRYAQGFLSGLILPEQPHAKPELVELRPIGGEFHQLRVYESSEDNPSEESSLPNSPTVTVDLTTVQLFDLVEAIDQFLADSQTLPELSLQLKPLSKRYLKPEQPVAQRVKPAAIGVSSLALTALALFALPIPDVKRPQDPKLQPQAQTETIPTPSASPPTGSPSSATSEAPLASNLSSPQPITNPQELNDLKAQLDEKLDKAWTPAADVKVPLVYRVSVAKDGAIVGYKPLNPATETATATEQTPLPDLLYKPVGNRPINEPLADFQVTFNPDGSLEVRSLSGINNQ
ncbi:DUF4335 domain-containing protein [Planktothrix pseudagardhii]|uniref:DUF4335 domain-containing protein n=1 Tax=Planktothrix pseudagardhii TaxID=132604 RepID=A0A9W4G574_9CYAN|nr:DUF4335 domain-containing protein [Planktothrix pseudagardhii]CAD5947811.1 hypothetical protein NO713_02355 [Planktothrix pseudagardhii]